MGKWMIRGNYPKKLRGMYVLIFLCNDRMNLKDLMAPGGGNYVHSFVDFLSDTNLIYKIGFCYPRES